MTVFLRMRRSGEMVFVWVLAVCGLVCWREAMGHGDLHEQIVELTRQLEKEPGNADLYLRRGELHRAHGEWDAAQADYERVRIIRPGLGVLDLARGRMFLEAGWPLSAKDALGRFLGTYPEHVEALTVRARALEKLGEHLAAAADYTAAIKHSKQPGPELYIERAQVLTAAGGPHLRSALEGLDEGIKRLGALVTLQLSAIDVELRQDRFDEALGRLDLISAQSTRKETWLARRGEILRKAGRAGEADEAFRAALGAIEKLPLSRRRVPAMLELEKRLKEELKRAGEP